MRAANIQQAGQALAGCVLESGDGDFIRGIGQLVFAELSAEVVLADFESAVDQD
ncbi:MAG: hypothetical protein Q8R92_17595 [Deltaproteobacteria bacterium]|nr:hypothetical protein [Deltaproteobacteria bacterium]